jgi:hypothetical protein
MMRSSAELDAITTKLDELNFKGYLIIAGNCAQLSPVLPGVDLNEQPAYSLPTSEALRNRFLRVALRSQQRLQDAELLRYVRMIGYGTYPRYQAGDCSPIPGDIQPSSPNNGDYDIQLP